MGRAATGNHRKKRETSQTLVRGLRLLELIGDGKSSLSIRELAEDISVPKTIVHRLLKTLEGEGYICKDSAKPGYRLGTKLWSLGCAAIQGLEIKQLARPYLEDLARKTGELVALAVLDGREIVYIDKIDSSRAVRAYIPVGGRAPAYCISSGKAILAYRSDDVKMITSSLKQFTSKTVAGIEPLKRQLAEIRRRGYAINWGEWHEDVGGVASAIRDREGSVVAAIAITVPIHRLTKRNTVRLGRLSMKVAAAVSKNLGYSRLAREIDYEVR